MQSRDAVIAKRVDDGSPDTDEIAALAEAAGHEVVARVTQTRPEDSSLQFGRGKAEELAETVAETDASLVVFDNDLTPTQTVELAELCPDGTTVVDRHRLVLDIFEEQVGSKRAELQVERATLEWNLPRIRESTQEQAMNKFTESGTRYYDVLDRIDELDRKLADFGDDAEARRERRREEGFEFVALAGYTNAGKSTLLHRLADDLDFEDREVDHADLDATAEIEDRLFKTLDTTTRRATVEGRRTLVTDTVGFVGDLPHDLVASFHGTLSETETADCVVLVADAGDPPTELRRKLETSFDLLEAAEGEVVVALNKTDLLSADECAEREAVAAEVAAESAVELSADPVPVSASEGRNLDALRERIAGALSDRRTVELALPNDDDAMSVVSWLYDRAEVSDVTYAGGEVRVEFAAKGPVVERAKSRASALEPNSSEGR
ncbi:GTPase HflX (plasmid) [Halorussus limi]|uniref:GTPase HflX n=1 Tax=Halorussus limi TaxID=2938695 RepID=A0A8U0HZW2_9EURY|nr:GTPase HflX [Halorussus limi]UPV76560.1 GTPase HflX [Halorussus limi]